MMPTDTVSSGVKDTVDVRRFKLLCSANLCDVVQLQGNEATFGPGDFENSVLQGGMVILFGVAVSARVYGRPSIKYYIIVPLRCGSNCSQP